MKLIVVNSNSSGNSYALDSGTEILLLEAGVRMAEVKRNINFRLSDVVGCIVTHEHGDHAKYATDYAKLGIDIYGPQELEQKQFPYGKFTLCRDSVTTKIGSFSVCPFRNYHDVEIYGYLIHHPDCGSILFSTDSYKLGMTFQGIDHFLIEANYEDSMLKENVHNGSISKAQSDRIMLSHMSLNYCIDYLRDCGVGGCATTTKTVTLCHLSERNANPDIFRNTVAGVFGIPTYIAQRGAVIELSTETLG